MAAGKDGKFLFFLRVMVYLGLGTVCAFAETLVVEGEMTFRYAVLSGEEELLDAFPEYVNNSNSQKVVSRAPGRIVVENRAFLTPFAGDGPFPSADGYRDRPDLAPFLEMATRQSGLRITIRDGIRSEEPFEQVTPLDGAGVAFIESRAKAMTAGTATRREAVEAVVLALREEVDYLLNASHDPVRVLRSGKADCDGYSNAAALLLRSLDIPVRVVDSWIPPGHLWGYGEEGSGGFHAHIEVYYDDAGWVSSDVQATLHFVDPYHIVGFPRSGARIEQLEEEDSRVVSGMTSRPAGENHFFSRPSVSAAYPPLFTGKVRDRNGELLRDSPRSGKWIYLRGDDGGGGGVLILPTGEFAVSPSMFGGETSGSVFYPGEDGSYFEHFIDFSGMKSGDVLRREFDLSRREEGVTLLLPPPSERLYRWHSAGGKGWSLEQVAAPGGRLRLLSSLPGWIVSLSRNPADPRYGFSPSGMRGEAALRSLPVYLEPGKRYIVPGEGLEGMKLLLADRSGRTYDAGELLPGRPAMVPDDSFDRFLAWDSTGLYFGTAGRLIEESGAFRHDIVAGEFDRVLELDPGAAGALLILEKDGRRWRRTARIPSPASPYLFRYRGGEEKELENFHVLPEGGQVPLPLR